MSFRNTCMNTFFFLFHYIQSSVGLNLKSDINVLQFCMENISIYHECEGGIEKSVPRITDWHHEACRVMTNGNHEGQIFLSHPHNGFFFLLTT